MATTISDRKLNISDLDFDLIKGNLKSFLSNQSVFSGYDFSASAMNVLMDILAYNTHYNAFYMNMLANELFIDTADLRSSVVSKAKLLNYVPRSNSGAEASVYLAVTASDAPASVVVDRFTKFQATIEGKRYIFSTPQTYTLSLSSAGTYTNTCILREGYPVTFTFTKNSIDPEQKFIIPNSNIDINTLSVTVHPSITDTTKTTYTLAGDFTTVKSTSTIYFLNEISNGRYEIEFGDGNIGKALSDGNIITLSSLVSDGEEGNGATSFSLLDPVGGYSTATITTLIASANGSNRESIKSIKFNAPKTFSAQKRAVSAEDYRALIHANYPEAESVRAWGGEDQPTPVYGRVYIAVKPKNANILSDAQKTSVVSILSDRKILSITPEIIDPDVYNIKITATVKYDAKLTTYTAAQISALVKTTIENYNTADLRLFDTSFKYSKLLRLIDTTEYSIVNSLMDVLIYKSFIPSTTVATTYTLYFNNAIKHPFDGYLGAVTSTTFTYTDIVGTSYSDCLLEDYNGYVRVYKTISGVKTIIRENIGTVDYTNGIIVLSAFLPTSLTGGVLVVYFESDVADIAPKREQIILIGSSDVSISVTDVSTIESRGATSISSSTTTTSTLTSSY